MVIDTFLLLYLFNCLKDKASLGKFKKIEIIPSIFSDHNAVRLNLNYKRGLERSPGEGNGSSLQYSCLENPMDGGAW